MTTTRKSRFPLQTLLVGLMLVPPVAIVASLPWLGRQPNDVVFLWTGIASALTVSSSLILAVLQDRQLDEWQRSGARFSTQWGWTAGASLVALLLSLTPFRDMVVSLVARLMDAPDPNHSLVVVAFTSGFMAVVIAQLLCTAVLNIGWTVWKSRTPRELS